MVPREVWVKYKGRILRAAANNQRKDVFYKLSHGDHLDVHYIHTSDVIGCLAYLPGH